MLSFPAFDTSLFYGINHGAASPWLDAAGRGLTWIGEHLWVLIPAVPFIWRNATGGWKVFWALLLPLALLSDSIPNLLKSLFERSRPFVALSDARLLVPIDRLQDFGFPSNHATNSFAVAALAFCTAGPRPASWFLLAAAVIVSLSRVYIGVHYPLDITVGAVLGSTLAGSLRVAHRLYVESSPTPRGAYWRLVGVVALVGGAVQVAWRLVRSSSSGL